MWSGMKDSVGVDFSQHLRQSVGHVGAHKFVPIGFDAEAFQEIQN